MKKGRIAALCGTAAFLFVWLCAYLPLPADPTVAGAAVDPQAALAAGLLAGFLTWAAVHGLFSLLFRNKK